MTNFVYLDHPARQSRRGVWKSAFVLALSAAGTAALYLLAFEPEGLTAGALITLIGFELATLAVIDRVQTGSVEGKSAARGVRPAPAKTQATFTETATKLMSDCYAQKQPLAMLVVQLSDLPELRGIFGDQHSRRMVRKLFLALQAFAPPQAVVVRTDAAVFSVLMPGLDRRAACAAFERTFGHTLTLEFDAGEDEIVLVPDVLIRSMPANGPCAAGIYEEMLSSIKHARALEARREQRLRRQHESYYTKGRLVESLEASWLCATP